MDTFRQTLASMHLGEYERLLAAGHPPLYLQLLLVNGLLFAFWAVRRVRASKHQSSASFLISALLVIVNGGVLYYAQMNA